MTYSLTTPVGVCTCRQCNAPGDLEIDDYTPVDSTDPWGGEAA